MKPEVAVLLYPGCIFFEIALATEVLAPALRLRYYTPDGQPCRASNAAPLAPDGRYDDLAGKVVAAVLVPGGDPGSILRPRNLARPVLEHAAATGALLASICAGNLVLAACGLLVGRRGTHNYTAEHAPAQQVRATARFWQGMRFERADLVQDERLITAQPWAYRRYAAAVARHLGVIGEAEALDLERYPLRRAAGPVEPAARTGSP